MKKRTSILIITIIFLIFIIANATYAYFATSAEIINNLSFEAIFNSSMPAFTAEVKKDLSLNVYTTDMLQHSDVSVKSAEGIIDITALSASSTAAVVCTYDIDLVWDSEGYVPSTTLPTYDTDNKAYPYELSIKGIRETEDPGYTYQDKNLSEINISNITFKEEDGEKRANLIKGAEIHNQSVDTATTTKWTFTLSFYSLPVSQNGLLGKTFTGHLVVSNAVC